MIMTKDGWRSMSSPMKPAPRDGRWWGWANYHPSDAELAQYTADGIPGPTDDYLRPGFFDNSQR